MIHPLAKPLRKLEVLGLLSAIAGLLVTLIVLIVDTRAFFQGYLFAVTFCLCFPLGCLTLLMIHHLSAGGWGWVTQRFLEAGALTIIPLTLLFAPLLFGMHDLYEWTHEAVVAEDAVLRHKRPYLNAPFFIIRAGIYFAAWNAMAICLVLWSRRLDEFENPKYVVYMRRLSGGGLLLHTFLISFAWLDWVMSLEPHWYSQIYGWLIGVGQVLLAIVIIIPLLGYFGKRAPLKGVVKKKHLHDWGNLLLTFVVLWSYMMFVQYLIIWSGNIPEGIEWYVHRQEGLWLWAGRFMIVFHFAIPFALLLLRRVKRSVPVITTLCAGLLMVHVVYYAWLVFPAFEEVGAPAYIAGFAALAGLAGVTIAAFCLGLLRLAMLPAGDPRIEEKLKQRIAT